MLKAIKTGRPLVHLIKAWAIVGPHLIEVISIKCVMDVSYQSKLIIFESLLNTSEASVIFRGSWGNSENRLEPKTELP